MEKGMKFESVGFQQVSEEWYSYYLREKGMKFESVGFQQVSEEWYSYYLRV